MKKVLILLGISFSFLLSSCNNMEYVGVWRKDLVLSTLSPLTPIPDEIIIGADYSFQSTGTFDYVTTNLSGTYNLTSDSLIFGTDSMLKFKVIDITATYLTLQRHYVPGGSSITVRYIRQ